MGLHIYPKSHSAYLRYFQGNCSFLSTHCCTLGSISGGLMHRLMRDALEWRVVYVFSDRVLQDKPRLFLPPPPPNKKKKRKKCRTLLIDTFSFKQYIIYYLCVDYHVFSWLFIYSLYWIKLPSGRAACEAKDLFQLYCLIFSTRNSVVQIMHL